MKENFNLYQNIPVTTEDGQYQLIVDINSTQSVIADNHSLHAHSCYELFYVETGVIDIICSDRVLTLNDHMMLIIPPDTLHRMHIKSEDLKRYIISFQVSNISEKNPFYRLFHHMKSITFGDFTQIQNAFLRFSQYYADHPAVRRPLMGACFQEVLYLLKKRNASVRVVRSKYIGQSVTASTVCRP